MIRIIAFIACLALLSFAAQAQQTPTFNILDLGPMSLSDKPVAADPVTALDNVGNKEMKTVLQLQNEISMINALTNWETQVSKLREAYDKAGLPFTSPTPPYAICKQVPPNSVCGDAYPEMALTTPSLARAPIASAAPTTMPKKEVEVVEPVATFEWDNIQCKASDCRAVLVDLTSGARVTVLPGEMLDENIMVQKISATGVTLTIKGKTEILKPARKNEVAASADKDVSLSLDETLKTVPKATETSLATPPSSAAPESAAETAETTPIVLDDGKGQSDAVGATGLF